MSVTTLALGHTSDIEVDDADVGDFASTAEIGGWTSGSLTLTRANVESTNIDTAGYRGTEYGIKSATLSLEVLCDEATDAMQEKLLDDYNDGTKPYIRVRPRVGTGHFEYEAQWCLDSVTYTLEQGGLVRFSLAATSHGTITMADQT